MAFVIYSMGHILAPSTKHDVSVIDYWAAIANTDKIVDFNFCEYVFADLLAAYWQLASMYLLMLVLTLPTKLAMLLLLTSFTTPSSHVSKSISNHGMLTQLIGRKISSFSPPHCLTRAVSVCFTSLVTSMASDLLLSFPMKHLLIGRNSWRPSYCS
ncbi:hypothetical protein CFC21_008891 [Triticum aestivum]|uniref:Uncharacterized protein n=2 Tax=Triticum aestivum TaxID=4565 RepID=A0A9R1DHB1_WHEAT|nr:hypothetical protein CFC21_008891 [Triticum aestivum]